MNGEDFALDQVSRIDVGHRYFVFQVVDDGDAVVFCPSMATKANFSAFLKPKH